MADSNVAITAGTGTNIDTQVPSGGDHRQVVVLGDPNTVANVGLVRANGEIYASPGLTTTTGNLTAADAASTSNSWAPGTAYTGTPTAGSVVSLTLDGQSSVIVQLSGTFTAAASIERSVDGGTRWLAVPMVLYPPNPSGTPYGVVSAANSPTVLIGDCAGSTHVRVRCASYTSGTVAVTLTATGVPPVPKAVALVDASGLAVTITGNALKVIPTVPGTGIQTSVSAATSSTTILSSSSTRLRYSLFNDSTSALYLRDSSSAASTTSFTVKIGPGGYWEDVYSGAVTGIWDAANGSARITSYS